LEAAAHGCVIVMTQSCGISEWLVHDVHCLKTARTAEHLADVFGRILQGTIDLAPIARRASAVIWRDFHLDGILARVELALMRAARQNREGAACARTTKKNGPDDAYRLALLADKLSRALIHEQHRQAA
ncbi:MAG: glycosyltransferase, partial [Candidatus Saccharimonadales bacterium]